MINLIAAVGVQGQIGYQGRIPWLDDKSIANVTKADLSWFAKQTDGGILIVGQRTFREMLTMGFKPGARDVWAWDGSTPPGLMLEWVDQAFPGRDVWICGGGHTYRAFMPFVQRFHISRIPWDGPADTYLPPILENLGYVGGRFHRVEPATDRPVFHPLRTKPDEPR